MYPEASSHSKISGNALTGLELGNLALEAAIELDRSRTATDVTFGSVGRLAEALAYRQSADLALVPAYQKALSKNSGERVSTRSDFDSRLREIADRMSSTNSASSDELDRLRNFCLALHDALLSQQMELRRAPFGNRDRKRHWN